MNKEAALVTEATITAEHFFTTALGLVESESVRNWATTTHNRPIFIQLAQMGLDKGGTSADPHLFAAMIVGTAIGL